MMPEDGGRGDYCTNVLSSVIDDFVLAPGAVPFTEHARGGGGGGGGGGVGEGPGLTLFGLQPPLTSVAVLNQHFSPSQTPAAQLGRFVQSVQQRAWVVASPCSRERCAAE